MAEVAAPPTDQSQPVQRKQLALLLALAAVVGLVVSFASWCFLQGIHELQQGVYDDLPRALGFDNGAPRWWSLPCCGLAGLITAFAIVRLPGRGGHIRAEGLHVSPTQPIELPGVMLVLLPLAGLAIAGLEIAFSEAADHSVSEVLFSGEVALPSLVSNPGAWSVSALALLIAFKGVAWSIALGGFRGGPVFPALFLGAAAGMLASHLPRLELTPAVGVGMGAAIAAVLGLPLSAVVLAALLTAGSGAGASPVIIVGVIVAYLMMRMLTGPPPAAPPARGAATETTAAPPVPA